MTTTATRTPGSILVPNELERRQIFHLFKQHTSYTAHKRILGFYEKWAQITEDSVRVADNSGMLANDQSSISYANYVNILKAVAAFEEGVTRLGKGDKRVFTYTEANSFFYQAGRETSYWGTLRSKVAYHDIEWKEATPYSKEFFRALDELNAARTEFRRFLEHSNPTMPASLNYGLWEALFLSRLPYPEPLPEVPEPKEESVVATGTKVPSTGIWEPMEEGRIVGPMNYLNGGAIAPKLSRTQLNTSNEFGLSTYAVSVTWRLIWRDDRYEDGRIPEEEKGYIFVYPTPEGVEDPYPRNVYEVLKYIKKHNIPHPFLDPVQHPSLPRCEANKPCPQTGYWYTLAKENSRAWFEQGAIMPNFPLSKYGATIWYWDESQEASH